MASFYQPSSSHRRTSSNSQHTTIWSPQQRGSTGHSSAFSEQTPVSPATSFSPQSPQRKQIVYPVANDQMPESLHAPNASSYSDRTSLSPQLSNIWTPDEDSKYLDQTQALKDMYSYLEEGLYADYKQNTLFTSDAYISRIKDIEAWILETEKYEHEYERQENFLGDMVGEQEFLEFYAARDAKLDMIEKVYGWDDGVFVSWYSREVDGMRMQEPMMSPQWIDESEIYLFNQEWWAALAERRLGGQLFLV